MDYGDDFLGSDDDFLASEDEYLQSIEEDGTIYDDINLEDEIADNVDEKILDIINNKLLNGEIEDYSYALDNILIKYKKMLIYKKFNVDDEIDKKNR